jgi:DNA-binding transcriptional ArsR family regulator
MRLGIVSALAANESLTFNDLKSLMNTTDGNLSVHARKLEDGGYMRAPSRLKGGCQKLSTN